jgi:hypothetical protein
MSLDFQGTSRALTGDGLAAATDALGVAPAEFWTVLAVETKGCGFLADRRPPILFERHVFSRLTTRRFDVCDVSNPDSGGYGPDGAHQYDRLATAIAFDRTAALQSASWGMAQIMGENFRLAGFADVESMVAAMCDSEDGQVAAFVSFLKARRLDACLRAHQWADLAKGYNGSSFLENHYDTKLAANFASFSAGALPDLAVRTAQMYLTFANFHPGPVDGMMGVRTRAALVAYQQQQKLTPTGEADPDTLASLESTVLPQAKSQPAG